MSLAQNATGGLSRVPYLPGVDGLRAIAVMAVVVYHGHHSWLEGGYIGVEVFFVISGYLITLLLLGEHERNRRIDIQGFWLRRARRLLPALVVLFSIVAIYIAAFYPATREQSRGDFVAGVFYVSNWYQLLVGQGYGAAEAFVPLRHLWSLAVEEQFYLVWPVVMAVVLSRRRYLPNLARRFVGVAVVVAVATAALYRPGVVAACGGESNTGLATIAGHCINVNEFLYLGSLSRSSGLLLGAGFALVWRPAAIMRGAMRDRGFGLGVMAFAALGALGWLAVSMHLIESGVYNPWLFRGGLFLVGVLTLVVLAAVTHQRSFASPVLGNPVLRWLGTRSYGLYLYHWPIFQMFRTQANIELSLGQFVAALAISLVVTEISFRLVEMPVRQGRLGAIIGTVRQDTSSLIATGSIAAVVLLAVGSLVVADPACVGAQRCAETANAIAGGGPSDGTTPDGSTATSLPPEPVPFIAIGESVMVGAAADLRSAGVFTDAKENRGPEGVKNAVIALRDDKRILGEGTAVVIQVGTNAALTTAALDAILAEIPDGTGPVFFLTLYADLAYIDRNNELIAALPGRYPGVGVIDWHLVAPNAYLCADGIHITCNGTYPAVTYTNLILAALGLDPLPVPTPPSTSTTSTTVSATSTSVPGG
ncbi:MAG: acyltransferase family protein [Ilumatobacteraceae bacterium]